MEQHNDHRRIVLLFDLDCFYAQCERVRLGLENDCSLALLQWNSVLAVTYPARKFGIKRGDSWDAVYHKSNGTCKAIHLHILEKTSTSGADEDKKNEEDESSIKAAFDKNFKLSPEQKSEARKQLGVRKFHQEGKACLERYRLASMRIFTLVLESLNKHVGGGNFILERASIDEFYLDITKYCYTKDESNKAFEEKQRPKTVIVGPTNGDNDYLDAKRTAAFERACWVTHWIRTDVWQTIGFTMSAGISTNKTMAKLAASYGKPNGQALLPPQNFPYCLRNIKIQKVRNFGGKLGKQILQKFLSGSDESATMEDLAQIPLPVLQKSLSSDTAQFVYLAARGIDREAVKETTGALVKSITAFKSFTATSDKEEIETWLEVLSSEVISRVQKDTSRNHRYPKSCTLNYTYYTTPSGQRPKDGTHRSQRYTKSLRLEFPNERQANKASNLKKQAMEILLHIIKEQPLRGVGLSANNFESRGGAGGSIDRFFASGPTTSQITNSIPTTAITRVKSKQKPHGVGRYFTTAPSSQNESSSSAAVLNVEKLRSTHNSSSAYQSDITTAAATSHQQVTITIEEDYLTLAQQPTAQQQQLKDVLQPPNSTPTALVDRDMEMAKKLQASFDRENYVLSKAEQKRLPAATNVQRKQKIRKIDSFFGKR